MTINRRDALTLFGSGSALALPGLATAARTNGIDDLASVRIAVLEANGRISFFGAEGAGASAEPPAAG